MTRKAPKIVIIAATSLALSACGGGGDIASTPPPPPTPTPTPTPPPSLANADLLGPLQSESFTNNAVAGTASYPTGNTGTPTSTSSDATVTFIYDAPSQTYTMTNGTRSQSFAPTNIDTASSSSLITVYKKVNGSTTDTLTITKPGTSGPLTYKYVGGAFWQRTVQGATTISGNFDAAAYGVETPDAGVPRSGGGGYDVTLLGVVARPYNLFSLAGEGKLTINFLDGTVTGGSFANGVREYQADNGFPGLSGEWKYNGTLSSSANAISGTMTLYHNSTAPIAGPGSGRLYGPTGNEVGIAFQGSGADGTHMVGVMLGRKTSNTIQGNNPSLVNMQFDQTFPNMVWKGHYYPSSSVGGPVNDWGYNMWQYGITNPLTFRYNATTGAYEFAEYTGGPDPVVKFTTTGTADAALSDGKFLGYSSTNANEAWRIRIYKPGTGNTELALTYASYFNLYRATANGSGWSIMNYWMPFGIVTPNAAMPTTGSASYAGQFNGNATNGSIGDELATASGPVNLAVNFGTAVVTGDFHPVITYSNGTTYDLGLMTLTNGGYNNPGVNQQGVIGPPGFGAQFSNGVVYNGLIGGVFFGPTGQEIAGTVSAQFVPQGTSGISGVMWGGFGAKKGP